MGDKRGVRSGENKTDLHAAGLERFPLGWGTRQAPGKRSKKRASPNRSLGVAVRAQEREEGALPFHCISPWGVSETNPVK